MSRRPKSFLVLLLVTAFLMTQVAMAGAAWYVDWDPSWPTTKVTDDISGTVYQDENVYTIVYAKVTPGTTYTAVSDVIDGASSGEITLPISSLKDGYHYVTLHVYNSANLADLLTGTPDVAQYVYQGITRINSYYQSGAVGNAYAQMRFSIDDDNNGGNPPGGGSPSTPTAPTTVTTSASVAITAADGGSVTAGGITINVPAGALSGDGTINVTPVTDLTNIPAGALVFGSTVVEITVTGAELIAPVTITLNYDAAAMAGIPAEQIGVYYWNEARAGWVYVGGTVNAATGQVSVAVNHFTKFAVMADKALTVPADIAGHWAFDSIKRLLGMKVVSGYPDGSYQPNNNITRAEFAKIIVDAMGYKVDAAAPLAFADAADIGDWAKGYVATAVAKGLISGYSDNTFKPANQITRAEIATIVVKALGKAPEGTPAFADASSVPAWAAGYINVAAKEGILSGYTDNTIKATNNATRAEAAKMTTNMLTNLKI